MGIPLTSGLGVGFKFAPQGFYFLPELSRNLSLGVGGQLAFSIHPFGGEFGFSWTTWMFDIVPSARLRYAINPKTAVYGQAGLGLGIVNVGYATPLGSGSNSTTAFLIKLGGGAEFQINPKVAVTGGMDFNIYAMSGGFTVWTLTGGLLYRI